MQELMVDGECHQPKRNRRFFQEVQISLIAFTVATFFAIVAISCRDNAGLPDMVRFSAVVSCGPWAQHDDLQLMEVALGGKIKINTVNGPMLLTVRFRWAPAALAKSFFTPWMCTGRSDSIFSVHNADPCLRQEHLNWLSVLVR
jgi:hypothetical protein